MTAVTLMTNVCGADVSTPPFAVPPSSCAVMVMVALPLASAAGVNVSVPLFATDGWTLNIAELVLLVTLKWTVWPDSSAGPALIDVAHPLCV